MCDCSKDASERLDEIDSLRNDKGIRDTVREGWKKICCCVSSFNVSEKRSCCCCCCYLKKIFFFNLFIFFNVRIYIHVTGIFFFHFGFPGNSFSPIPKNYYDLHGHILAIKIFISCRNEKLP